MPNSSLRDLLAYIAAAKKTPLSVDVTTKIVLTFEPDKLEGVDLEKTSIQTFLDVTGAKATLMATSTAPHGTNGPHGGKGGKEGEDDPSEPAPTDPDQDEPAA